jgi:hypothetical protein
MEHAMSAEHTDRHQLPMIQPGQAQKEMTHNEALVRLDMLLMAAVEGIVDAPPDAPVPGDCWIVGPAATGAFAGRAHAIAGWTDGGWRFVVPREGATAFVIEAGSNAIFRNAAWEVGIANLTELHVGGERVVSTRQPAIMRPAGGDRRDAEARIAIDTIIDVLSAHGLIAAG